MYHCIVSFATKIAAYIRKHGMITPGDRVGVAVSGGADSVALLRALVELRGEMGCVLAVVHFNHMIRGAASDQDAAFVERLAREFGLEFLGSSGEARGFAAQQRVSLETAARELRYGFFLNLAVDKIATAHTLDDQAETVLMKLLRGAGAKGLSGIWPMVRRQEEQHSAFSSQQSENQRRTAKDGCATQNLDPSTRASRSLGMTGLEIIRPMLGARRKEVEAYLRALGQEWREDASNRDVTHTRNKVRHELLPLLEREYNPNIYQQLADTAEVARAEEEFWEQYLEAEYPVPSTQYAEDADPSTPSGGMTSVLRRQEAGRGRQESAQYPVPSTKKSPRRGPSARAEALARDDNSIDVAQIDVAQMVQQPLAVRRRIVRKAFRRASGKALDFEHTDALIRLLERRESSLLQLPEHWFAMLDWPRRVVTFEERIPVRKAGTAARGKTSKKQGAASRR